MCGDRMNSTFSISYGSGQASGNLAQDQVTLGGYSVASQTFAACSSLTPGLISSSVSGIMGLSWQALAYSKGAYFPLERGSDANDGTQRHLGGSHWLRARNGHSRSLGSIWLDIVMLPVLPLARPEEARRHLAT